VNSRSHQAKISPVRYDMVYLRALKIRQEGQLNLAHGIKNEKMRKTTILARERPN